MKILGIFLGRASNIISATLHASLIYADIVDAKHNWMKFTENSDENPVLQEGCSWNKNIGGFLFLPWWSSRCLRGRKITSSLSRPVSWMASFWPAGGNIIPEICVAISNEKPCILNSHCMIACWCLVKNSVMPYLNLYIQSDSSLAVSSDLHIFEWLPQSFAIPWVRSFGISPLSPLWLVAVAHVSPLQKYPLSPHASEWHPFFTWGRRTRSYKRSGES